MSSTDKNSSVPQAPAVTEAPAASEPLEDCGGQPCSSTLKHLYEFLDRELSPEQVHTIQAHLNACPECADVKDFELMVREKLLDYARENGLRPSTIAKVEAKAEAKAAAKASAKATKAKGVKSPPSGSRSEAPADSYS